MRSIKLRKVGNSFDFTVPKELIEKYNLKEGEEIYIIENNDSFTLTPYNPDFKKWANAFDKTNKKFKNTLKELSVFLLSTGNLTKNDLAIWLENNTSPLPG